MSWARRHRVITAILWVHVVWIVVWGQTLYDGWVHPLLEAGIVAALAIIATVFADQRRPAAGAATLGLLASSGILVHFSQGLIEMHFHFFVMVALITLYQSWLPFLLAIGFVVIHHGTVGVLDPSGVYNHAAAIADPWKWALVHGSFIAAMSAVGLATWKLNELSQKQAQEYYKQLYEGEQALASRLKEADQLKEEFLAIVSHELRTPLTAIIGFAGVLERGPEPLSAQEQRGYASRILRQGKRLNALVENLLGASKAVAKHDEATSKVDEVLAAALEQMRDVAEDHPIVVNAEAGLEVQMPEEALALILSNILGNAVKFSRRDSPVSVDVKRCSSAEVQLSVGNTSELGIPVELREKILEPFFQGPTSNLGSTRGVGLGLHIVNRLVTRYGGRLSLDADGDVVTFSVTLLAANQSAQPDPVSL